MIPTISDWTCVLDLGYGAYRVSAMVDGVFVQGWTRRALTDPTPAIMARMVAQAERAKQGAKPKPQPNPWIVQ
jgi:hypothetical protein